MGSSSRVMRSSSRVLRSSSRVMRSSSRVLRSSSRVLRSSSRVLRSSSRVLRSSSRVLRSSSRVIRSSYDAFQSPKSGFPPPRTASDLPGAAASGSPDGGSSVISPAEPQAHATPPPRHVARRGVADATRSPVHPRVPGSSLGRGASDRLAKSGPVLLYGPAGFRRPGRMPETSKIRGSTAGRDWPPRSPFASDRSGRDENPGGSRRPLGQTSQTLSDSWLTPSRI